MLSILWLTMLVMCHGLLKATDKWGRFPEEITPVSNRIVYMWTVGSEVVISIDVIQKIAACCPLKRRRTYCVSRT